MSQKNLVLIENICLQAIDQTNHFMSINYSEIFNLKI